MLAVVGLGNPGSEYAANRHNIGFQVVTAFRARYRLPAFERERWAQVSRGRFRGRPVLLAKPQTFMNCSGEALRELMRADRLAAQDILVVVDDVYLPLGHLRLRRSGGDGGHNGLNSIIDALGTEAVARLRIGIGGPEISRDLAAYVLEDFESEEEAIVAETVRSAMEAVATVLTRGVGAAMNRFNAAAGDPGPGSHPLAGGQ